MILLNLFFCITSHDEVEGKHIYHIRLQPEHFVFKAHFPDAPIVLAYVKNIKYLKTMQPTEMVDYNLTLHEIIPEGNGYKVIASFSTPEATYAKLSLTFSSESI